VPYVLFEQGLHITDVLFRVAPSMRHQYYRLRLPSCVSEVRATTRLSKNKGCQRLQKTSIRHAVEELHGHYIFRPIVEQEAALREMSQVKRLCCTNPVRDSSCESSVVAGLHEQTHTPRLQDQELAGL
jgi:hypothetical protein